MLRLVIQLDRRTRVDLVVDLAQMAQHERLVGARRRNVVRSRRVLDFADVDDEHGVMRGHRATGFGDHVRRLADRARRTASASGCTIVAAYCSSP